MCILHKLSLTNYYVDIKNKRKKKRLRTNTDINNYVKIKMQVHKRENEHYKYQKINMLAYINLEMQKDSKCTNTDAHNQLCI